MKRDDTDTKLIEVEFSFKQLAKGLIGVHAANEEEARELVKRSFANEEGVEEFEILSTKVLTEEEVEALVELHSSEEPVTIN